MFMCLDEQAHSVAHREGSMQIMHLPRYTGDAHSGCRCAQIVRSVNLQHTSSVNHCKRRPQSVVCLQLLVCICMLHPQTQPEPLIQVPAKTDVLASKDVFSCKVVLYSLLELWQPATSYCTELGKGVCYQRL